MCLLLFSLSLSSFSVSSISRVWKVELDGLGVRERIGDGQVSKQGDNGRERVGFFLIKLFLTEDLCLWI